MLNLITYIKENKEIISESENNEAEAFRYLVNNFDTTKDILLKSAKDFYEISTSLKKAVPDIKDLEAIYIKRDEILKDRKNPLYKEVKQRPEPLVANYNNSYGRFAFRKWVKKIINEINPNLNIPDTKYHDTTLLGEGSWVPSAEEMEDIIALSWNSNNIEEFKESYIKQYKEDLFEDVKNIKIEHIIEYYESNKKIIDEISKIINITVAHPLRKLRNKEVAVSDTWKKIFENSSRPNRTPKTDIIDGNNKFKISLKKDGGAQLMSGAYYEAKATILTALRKSESTEKTEKLRDRLANILEKNKWLTNLDTNGDIAGIKKDENHPLHKLVMKGVKNAEGIQKVLNKLIDLDEKFKYELLYEAITGEVKFGKDSPGCANYILLWNDDNPEKSEFMSVDKYITEKLFNDKINFLINFKGANNKSWQNLRIICGFAKSTDSEKIKDISL